MKRALPAIIIISLLLCLASPILAGQASGTPTVTFTPIVQGDTYKKLREFKIQYDLKITVMTTGPDGVQRPKTETVVAEVPFGVGTTGPGISEAFELALNEALDERIPAHGINLSQAKDGSTLFAKGANIVGGSQLVIGTTDVTIAYNFYRAGFRSSAAGKLLRYDVIGFRSSNPMAARLMSGRVILCCVGYSPSKKIEQESGEFSNSTVTMLLYSDMTNVSIAQAFVEKLVDAGWIAEVNPDNTEEIIIREMPEGYLIFSTTILISYSDAQSESGIELPSYGFEHQLVEVPANKK